MILALCVFPDGKAKHSICYVFKPAHYLLFRLPGLSLYLQDYIDLCIRKLYPEVGCPGAWDSKVWNPIRE